ncbi:DUF2303 family protein [Actinomadura miaoliensis]|uniref:DUF2303 family protein n=1 Tax=Actinomadura miaoliensis TaxID=430685 RepID=A0ABP7V5K4_9ACTN
MSPHEIPRSVPRTENDALIEAAVMSTEPNLLEPGKVYGWMTPAGRVEKIDLTGDQYRDHPKRKTGTVTVRDVESFGQYWDKHADGDFAEVYADIDNDRVTAVLDAHGSAVPGWHSHHLVYTLRRTDAWKTWTAADGRLMGQVEFAELLEARLPDIAEPDGADLLELAQTFQATTNVSFKSGTLLANGERELVYSEQIEASGGRGRKLTIPKGITLMIAPYEDAAPMPLTGRFRYRIHEGSLRLGFVLDRPAEVLADAFDMVVGKVETRIGVDVMRGVPA